MSWKTPSLIVAFALTTVPFDALTADSAPPTNSYELRYRFTEDQELHYRIDDRRELDVQVGPKRDSARCTSNTLRRHYVKDVRDDGSATIELTLLRVRMTAESGVDTIEFDSATDGILPEAFRAVRGTIGQPLGLLTVSPRGTVEATQLLIPTQNAEEFASEQRDLLPILPEAAVAVGDVWRDPFEVDILVALDQPLKKRIRLERVYSLESVEGGIAIIDVRTVVLSPVEDGVQQGQLILRTTNGTIRFDIERGLLVDRSVTLDNTVVGFQGRGSSLTVEGTHRDTLIPDTDVAAEIPGSAR